jgi:hypothetical protein
MDAVPTSRTPLTIAAIALLTALLVLAATADAPAKSKGKKSRGKGVPSGKAFVPPKKKLYAGISDTGQTSDFREYSRQSGAHPAVMQSFESWGYTPNEALRRWRDTATRGMISLSTSRCWGCDAVISNEAIAQGRGDEYIVALGSALAKRKRPTYIRLFPEMNGHWNAYSAFKASGKPRGDAYSTANFKRAWTRFVLIVRGGRRKAIDRRLRKLRMPKIKTRTKRKLRRPKVSIAWVPQAQGSPNVPGNGPGDYFPGYRYVDWVGGDIYGKYPSLAGLGSLYRKYRKAPFMVGEFSPWDRDGKGFVKSLFRWVERKGRAKMAVYYQGFGEGAANDFELSDYGQARRALKRKLNSRRWVQYAPEERSKGKKKGGKGKKGKGKKRGGRR